MKTTMMLQRLSALLVTLAFLNAAAASTGPTANNAPAYHDHFFSDYVPLHRTQEIGEFARGCWGLLNQGRRALPQLWANHCQAVRRTAATVATVALTDHRQSNNNKNNNKNPATSTASSSRATTETASIEQQPSVEFAKFAREHNPNDVSTVLVATRNAKEKSLLLARLKSKNKPKTKKKQLQEEEAEQQGSSAASSSLLKHLTEPLIPQKVWDQLTGKEFEENYPAILDDLVQTGYDMATSNRDDKSNDDRWILWQRVKNTFSTSLEDGGVHVWTGRARVKDNNNKEDNDNNYHGASAPFIQTKSIIRGGNLGAEELIDLLLDNRRVKLFNQYSTGRIDLWQPAVAEQAHTHTKIVQNTNQVPLQKKPVRSTTLLHARQMMVKNKPCWLLVSRAIGPQHGIDDKTMDTSDILLGVNWIEPLSDNAIQMTAITHVYSKSMPGMLAERLGVKSAIQFVQDLRAIAANGQQPAEEEAATTKP